MTHAGLLAGYAAALGAWLLAARLFPWLEPGDPPPRFDRPWREAGYALIAAACVVLIGLVYSRGWLLARGARQHPVFDAIDQVIIYAPMPLLVLLRRHGAGTAWLPRDRIPARIGIGLAIAQVALLTCALVRGSGVPNVYSPGNLSYLVQVLLEDVSIAVLFARLSSAISPRGALVLVAVLFAGAHVPGMIAAGVTAAGLLPLAGDALLGVLVLSVLQRSRDVWWFWMVHFALDMTQFD